MIAQMLEVSLLGGDTVLRLKKKKGGRMVE